MISFISQTYALHKSRLVSLLIVVGIAVPTLRRLAGRALFGVVSILASGVRFEAMFFAKLRRVACGQLASDWDACRLRLDDSLTGFDSLVFVEVRVCLSLRVVVCVLIDTLIRLSGVGLPSTGEECLHDILHRGMAS